MDNPSSEWRPGIDPLPVEAICPRCDRWRASDPHIQQLRATLAKARLVALCVCPPAVEDETRAVAGQPMDVQSERVAQLTRYANLPEHQDAVGPRTFDNFRPRRGAELALTEAKAFADGQASYHLLLLNGHAGCGKSHLVEAIVRERVRAMKGAKYLFVPRLLDELRGAYDEEAKLRFLDLFDRYQGAPLLALDDLGTETVSPWVVEKLTTLVDERYRNGRDLVVATNLLRDDVARQYHERLASRLWDVHTGVVKQVLMTATDYRALHARGPGV